MLFRITFLLLGLISTCYTKIPPALSKVDEFRYKFIRLEQDIWNTVIDEQSNTISSKHAPELELIKNYKRFGDKIEHFMPRDITYGVQTLEDLWIWARTYGELRGVYALYESFRRFQKLQTDAGRVPSPKQAWIDLADAVLHDGKMPIAEALKKIHEFIKNEKLFQEALKEAIFKPCEIHQSVHQLLYHLYNSISLTELKGYMMMQFSWQLFKLYNMKGNFTEEAQLMRHRFYERSLINADSVKTAMNQTNRELWKCDPKQHVKGETYTELTKLLQGYIENEIDLSPSRSCFKNCAYYDYAKNNGCYKNGFCTKQPKCKGKILNCQFIDSDMWVCPAERNSNRRYEYIEYENGRVLGRKLGCNTGTSKVDSWWRYLFWHCSYCVCLCDDEEKSDRYFNLREYISDIDNNKVVTGLRFRKKNRIIHLQIQEGTLLPFGGINETTLRWKPVDDYNINDRHVNEGHDFHMLSFNKRDMDLDDLILENKYLVTGVRFRVIGTHLNLEIRATPFNFTSGLLTEPHLKSFWHSNDIDPVSRKRLYLQVPDIPIRSHLPSLKDSKNDQFIEFTNSDFDRDAAQTTVPFVDTQDVVPDIATPLSGAGIYHKGRPYFGGFVGPKIISYGFGNHINILFPPEIEQHDAMRSIGVN